jgi:hypothetical protein
MVVAATVVVISMPAMAGSVLSMLVFSIMRLRFVTMAEAVS